MLLPCSIQAMTKTKTSNAGSALIQTATGLFQSRWACWKKFYIYKLQIHVMLRARYLLGHLFLLKRNGAFQWILTPETNWRLPHRKDSIHDIFGMSCVWKLILPGKILKKLQDYPVLPRSAGVKKDYKLASSRFAVMFFRCILGRSWESLCGIINVGKKTELSGNWDRSFYRFSTFFSLPVFDSARFICSQLEPVRPPLTLFFYLKNSFSSFVILVWS